VAKAKKPRSGKRPQRLADSKTGPQRRSGGTVLIVQSALDGGAEARHVPVSFEDRRKKQAADELELEMKWKPRAMLVDGKPFDVKLWPKSIDAQHAWCVDHHLAKEYFSFCDDPEGVDDDYYDLKGYINVYFFGDEKTVRITVKLEADKLKALFPVRVSIPNGSQCIGGGGGSAGRIEWDNGDKQSLRDAAIYDSKNEDYDFVQTVTRERKKRALPVSAVVAEEAGEAQATRCDEAASRVALAAEQPPQAELASRQGGYPLLVGKLNVQDDLWNRVSFGRQKNVMLSGQVRQILKALYDLGAVSIDTAKTRSAILARAGIHSDIAISKPFTGGGKRNRTFKALYEFCVRNGNEKLGTARTYYLDT